MNRWVKGKWREKMWYLNPPHSDYGIDNVTLVDVCCDWKPLLFAFRVHHFRMFMGCSLAVTISPPRTFWSAREPRENVVRKVEAEITSIHKASAGSRRCFLTGNSCHLFASADWSSILLHSLLPYAVSMQRQTEMSAAEPVWHKKKSCEFALWYLWVQSEGKLRQGKLKHVPWMHGHVNCCCGLWSHWKTGCREQGRPKLNQGGK